MRDLLAERLAGYAPRQLALDYPEAGILVPVTDDLKNPEMIFTLRSENYDAGIDLLEPPEGG